MNGLVKPSTPTKNIGSFFSLFNATGKPANRQTGKPANRQTGKSNWYKQTLLFAFLMICSTFVTTQQSYAQSWEQAVIDSVKKTLSPDSLYLKNQLLIKFKPHALDLSKLCYSYGNENLTNKEKKVESTFGLSNGLRHYLNEQRFSVEELILDQSLINRLKSYGGDSLKRLTHANPCRDTISISRNGDTIPMAHYLYMILELNNDTSIVPALVWTNAFHRNSIDYSSLGGFCENLTKDPEDIYYGNQKFLTENYIGANYAWDYEVGDPNTLVGQFELGFVNFKHCDLGSGAYGQGAKVVYRGNYHGEDNDPNSGDISDHADAVAGIIAGYTNREGCVSFAGGIAGIAGGWGDLGGQQAISTGASLLGYAHNNLTFSLVRQILEAVANPPNSGYGQAIHIANFSTKSLLRRFEELQLEEALNFAQLNGVVLIGARGNMGSHEEWSLPSCFAPHKMINVGSSEKTDLGNLKKTNYSSFGRDMDLVAPAPTCQNNTNDVIYTSFYDYAPLPGRSDWKCYNGTSIATAQVSGATALLHSFGKKQSSWPSMDPEDYEGILKASAKDITGTNYSTNNDWRSGWGQLDLKEMFTKFLNGYKLYHFYQPHNNDIEVGTYGSPQKLVVSNPLNDKPIPAGFYDNVQTRTIKCKVKPPINWIGNIGNIYVWGRKGPECNPNGGEVPTPCELTGWPPIKPVDAFNGYENVDVCFQNGYSGVVSGIGGNHNLEQNMIHSTLTPNMDNFELVTHQYKFTLPNNTVIEIPKLQDIGFHYSVFAKITIVGVNELVDDISLNIFPSPSTSLLNITSDNLLKSSVNLIITNYIGEEVFSAKEFTSNRFKVDISKFPNGVYFASLVNGTNKISKQFVIAK